ncbi:MAG TPA: bifunctional nuclease family protein [Gemmatimonadaceae bacterium]|jgi:bifunctional DNase/RNase
MTMVEVVVAKLGLDSSNGSYVVVLQEKGGDRMLPIWIGQPEAESIVMEIHALKRSRPLTHDLCRNIILALGGELRRVQVTRVEQNTYFAELHVARGGEVVQVDARPSDSIAIALRFAAPIFAADSLLAHVNVESAGDEELDAAPEWGTPAAGSPSEPDEHGLSAEQLQHYLERLRPEDFGKFNP